MATGALIGGSLLGLYGQKKAGDAQKDAARANAAANLAAAEAYRDITLASNEEFYQNIQDSVTRSREIELERSAAEGIADAALQESNEAFRGFNEQKYANEKESSSDWLAVNRERRSLEMQNIALGAQERAEEIKRVERGNEIYEGRANTASQASGFGGGSSLEAWVDTIVATNASDVAWMVSAGEKRDSLAKQDANARYRAGEAERRATDRSNLLGFQTGEAKYDFYESQRIADAAMRDVDRQERDSARDSALADADATKRESDARAQASVDYTRASGQANMGAASAGANAGMWGSIGNAVGNIGSIGSSYKKYGWGF